MPLQHPWDSVNKKAPTELQREREAIHYIRNRGLLLTPFVKYKKRTFKTPERYTSVWDLDKIKADMPFWAAKLTNIKVYIIMNDAKNHSGVCYVGSSEDLEARIKQHNGLRKGGPSETRKAIGKWRLVFYCHLPPVRNFRSSDIVRACATVRGGPYIKIMKAVEVCMDLSIKFKVSKVIFNEASTFYSKKFSQSIRNMLPSGNDAEGKFVF